MSLILPDKEERPLDERSNGHQDEILPEDQVEEYEKRLSLIGKIDEMDRRSRSYSLASRLLIFCITMLVVLYCIDVFLINNEYINSNLLDGVFELLKYLVSSLVGFVFSSRLFSNKED